MVLRTFNKPVIKIQNHPVCWFKNFGAEWYCAQCRKPQQANTMIIEFGVEQEVTGIPSGKVDKYLRKVFVCMPCAIALLDDANIKLNTMKNLGVDGYKFMEKL